MAGRAWSCRCRQDAASVWVECPGKLPQGGLVELAMQAEVPVGRGQQNAGDDLGAGVPGGDQSAVEADGTQVQLLVVLLAILPGLEVAQQPFAGGGFLAEVDACNGHATSNP